MNNRDLAKELLKIASELDPYVAASGNPTLMWRLCKEGKVSREDGPKFFDAMNDFLAKHPEQVDNVIKNGWLTINEIRKEIRDSSGLTKWLEKDKVLRRETGIE